MLAGVPSRRPFRPVNTRTLACALCVAALLCLSGASAPAGFAASLGGGNALSELTEGGASETTETATTSSTTSESEPHNSKSLLLLGGGAAVLLLMTVAFVIVRDARRVAPVGDGEIVDAVPRRSEAAMRRRRAKAKAARQQRKRNR
jgi:hypothetical protein